MRKFTPDIFSFLRSRKQINRQKLVVVVLVVLGGMKDRLWVFWSLEKFLKSVSTNPPVVEWASTTSFYLVYLPSFNPFNILQMG